MKRATVLIVLLDALAALLAAPVPVSAAKKDAWIEVQTPNFTVLSNSGEKEARKIADQFEQFRQVFHGGFPTWRVDLGKPLIIFAVKNEASLRQLLPGYWEAKGRIHPGGIYIAGEDRHFVALRTNTEGNTDYEVVYHEYTHAILNLNFRRLPVWLGEGLAEFFGNSSIHDNYVDVGRIPLSRLRTLQENKLIPIDQLFQADLHSPYYNEENRASLFYAESWAIVHYLLLDPDARKHELLTNYLKSWQDTGDALGAAQKAFGNLKEFSQTIEAYSRHPLSTGKLTAPVHSDPKSYSSRGLPPAELAAQRSLFFTHTQRLVEARVAADEAVQADPNLPLAYEALGLLAYSEEHYGAAEQAYSRAIELHSTSYFPYFFSAQARLRHNRPAKDDTPEIAAMLEEAIAMNPQFAPAYDALGTVYSLRPETRQKALAPASKAVELEPGNLRHAINLAYVLLSMDRTNDAKVLAQRIRDAAKTPEEKGEAEHLVESVTSQEAYEKAAADATERAERSVAEPLTLRASESAKAMAPVDRSEVTGNATSKKYAGETEYASEGTIVTAECNPDSRGIVTLRVGGNTLRFYYSKLSMLFVASTAKADSGDTPACKAWQGRRARLYFYKTKDKPFTGELDTIQFF